MKNFLIPILLLAANPVLDAQVAIGKSNVDASAALDVADTGNKGVLLPRVDIIDILNGTTPIASPKEGLIVYNKGNSISPGLYIWKNNKWTLIADTRNTLGFMLLQRSVNYNILGGVPNGTFKNFNDAAFTVLKNEIGGSYNPTTGYVTLPGNSGYMVNICFNIITTQESATAGIGNGPLHLHQYTVKLIDPSTGIQYGKSLSINAQSLATTGARAHTLNLSFSFVTSGTAPIQLMPSIAHMAGGTYESGAGGIIPNNGEIIITTAKMDIERSVLNP